MLLQIFNSLKVYKIDFSSFPYLNILKCTFNPEFRYTFLFGCKHTLFQE